MQTLSHSREKYSEVLVSHSSGTEPSGDVTPISIRQNVCPVTYTNRWAKSGHHQTVVTDPRERGEGGGVSTAFRWLINWQVRRTRLLALPASCRNVPKGSLGIRMGPQGTDVCDVCVLLGACGSGLLTVVVDPGRSIWQNYGYGTKT